MLNSVAIAAPPLIDTVRNGNITYEAICYPAGTPSGDWSLAKLKVPGDEQLNPTEAERLGRVLASHGIKRAFAPRVADSSAIIVPKSELTDVIELPHGVKLFRNARLPADGTTLGPGDAFIMSGGGCPVIVV